MTLRTRINLSFRHPGSYIKLSGWLWEAGCQAHILFWVGEALPFALMFEYSNEFKENALLPQQTTSIVRNVL